MMKRVHLVYAKEFAEDLREAIEKELTGYAVTGSDHTMEQFKEFSTMKEDSFDIVLADGFAGIHKKQQAIELLKAIRLNFPNKRIVLQFVEDIKLDHVFIRQLVSLGLYDLHFVEEIEIDDIGNWFDKPKSIADYTHILSKEREEPEAGPVLQTRPPQLISKEERTSPGSLFEAARKLGGFINRIKPAGKGQQNAEKQKEILRSILAGTEEETGRERDTSVQPAERPAAVVKDKSLLDLLKRNRSPEETPPSSLEAAPAPSEPLPDPENASAVQISISSPVEERPASFGSQRTEPQLTEEAAASAEISSQPQLTSEVISEPLPVSQKKIDKPSDLNSGAPVNKATSSSSLEAESSAVPVVSRTNAAKVKTAETKPVHPEDHEAKRWEGFGKTENQPNEEADKPAKSLFKKVSKFFASDAETEISEESVQSPGRQFKGFFKETIVGTVKIGITGVENRTGTTHASIQSALYFARKGYRTACVELKREKTSALVTFATDEESAMPGGFSYQKVDFFPQASKEELYQILGGQYKYIVIDFGMLKEDSREDLFRTDLQVITMGASLWDFRSFSNLWFDMNQWNFRKKWHVLVNFGDKAIFNEMTEEIGNQDKLNIKMHLNQFHPDALKLNPKYEVFESMYAAIVPKQDRKKA